jgi:hypothetical protein
MQKVAFVSASLLLAACNHGKEGAARDKKAPAVPGQNLPKEADAPATKEIKDMPRNHLVLLSYRDDQAEGHLVVASIDKPQFTLSSEVPLKATPWKNWEGHYKLVAAADATGWISSYPGEAEGTWSFTHQLFTEEGPPHQKNVKLEEVAGLHRIEDLALAGTNTRLGSIDLRTENSSFTEIKNRREFPYKAYDVFARSGNLIVAVDDEVIPMFAEFLELDAKGTPKLVSSWSLPSIINGSFIDAIFEASSGRHSGTLYLLANYGIITGPGQLIAALEVKDGKLSFDSQTTLNSSGTGSESPRVREEFSDRTGPELKHLGLVYGTERTTWNGMAPIRKQGKLAGIALAAKARGLLILPANFGPKTAAQAIDVGGECMDVQSVGERLFALVLKGEKASLVEIAEAKKVVTDIELPRSYTRFAR